MATRIKHKRSSVAGKQPIVSQLESGELAINTADGKVYMLRDDNTVQDVTKRIFEGDTQVVVDDLGDSSQASVSVDINGIEQLTITQAGLNVKDNLDMENAKGITFRELTASGQDGITIKSPDNLPASYTMNLPFVDGTVGQLLKTNGFGQLEFTDADLFGGNVIYVSAEQGNDINDGKSAPVKSIKRACQLASGMVYNPDGTVNNTRINIKVAVGDYTEQNPIIVPDNVVIKGDGLRGCILRPANANLDILRVRNACYFGEFTFRDGVDENQVPLITADYAVSFDDPFDNATSRVGYTNLPNTRPTIFTSPYIQNCSLISFLGMNGAKIDGAKVQSPNVPGNKIEAENPVIGATPEQGKSMVANAFTILSFGGTGWRLLNDAYAQIVSCFEIFLLNGVYTQSGGYCSITNSATNFGLYALRSSGYSPKSFIFDRAIVTATGEFESKQTISIVGINREQPVEEYVIRFRDQAYKIAYELLLSNKNSIAQDTVDWIDAEIAGAAPGSIWENFVYDSAKFYRDTQLIVDAVAQDTWDTGNRFSRNIGLAYYSKNLQDSSKITISGQEEQTIAAIEQASVYAAAVIASLDSNVRAFVDEKFDIIKTIINDPTDLPAPLEVSSEGDLSNLFKPVPTEQEFDAAIQVNPITNIFTIVGHGYVNGKKVVYQTNGNPLIKGLDEEQNYYIAVINDDEFTLTFDDSLAFPVNIIDSSTGLHTFLGDVIEFYSEEILSTHSVYQTLILESGTEDHVFVPGRSITATTGANNNSAIVYSWIPVERKLVVSIEEVAVGSSTLRIQLDETSIITNDHATIQNTNIAVNEASARTDLTTSTFTVLATDGSSSLANLIDLPENQIWFHRPSIVNSSSHTWEFAGSGTDYNALPQNGGNTRTEYEQFAELPGRVYSSGTNELGDFKVGDFITAFNRTGNITFRNKVQVDELDALRLTLSDIAIEEISANVNLGDNELGGSKDSRLPTQLAVRSFIANRLGGFVDKAVSTAAVPGAIVQLNTNGQLNSDLIPATRQFTSTTTQGYLSKLDQIDEIPAVDLKAGDIGTEEYEQIELTFDTGITANDGDLITQAVTGAEGYAKGNYSSSFNLLVASTGAEFIAGDDSSGTNFDTTNIISIAGVSTGQAPTTLGSSSAIVDNFFLKSSNTGQYLLLESDQSYTFTSVNLTTAERNSDIATFTTDVDHNLAVGNTVQVLASDITFTENSIVLSVPTSTTFTIKNVDPADPTLASTSVTGTVRSIVTSADGNAQGAVSEYREGICTNVDNANITGGSGYTPINTTLVYEFVPLTSITGTGTGAVADITVTTGQVTDVDLRRGGIGYAPGDILGVSASNVGGTGSGFEVEIAAVQVRAYVNILGGELFVASAPSLDFIEDNTAVANKFTIALDNDRSFNFLAGVLGSGGTVDYGNNRITIPGHGYSSGDPLTYSTLGNVAIGGMINGSVYYAKYITDDIIELYDDFALINQTEFVTTPANNNHNLTRYNVNTTDNSILVIGHGLTTGDAIRLEQTNPGDSAAVEFFSVDGNEVLSGTRFFVGSVTPNSFTIHSLRSDALSSINGLVTNAKDITDAGQGDIDVIPNNAQVSTVVNTSSRLKQNWNSLAVTNIDASNIISGTVSPSRLASSGVASTDTFLRGDSSYSVAVQTIAKINTPENPITITGSSLSGEFYGAVDIGIANVELNVGGAFSTLGTAKFLQTQFNVNSNGSGEVFIKDGVVDAGTLDALDSAYFLNPANLTTPVPVTRGGTNLTTYAVGDIIYAQSTGSLNTLNIGRRNNFLKSNGTTPEWGTALDLAEGLDVGSAKLTSSSIGSGFVYNDNVSSLEIGGDAENIKIGSSTSVRNLTNVVAGFDATVSQDVAINLTNLTQNTNDNVGNGEKEIPMADTTGILSGMIITGSGSIPANTTVSGVTDEFIYLSTETTGTIITGTTLTFTYTPYTLGIRAGDTINISGSEVTNLDGSWPVSGATFNATSFTVRTNANVTANPVSPVAGGLLLTRDNTMVIKNRRVIFGSAEASASPVAATLRSENAIGTNVAGGTFIIQSGIGTGNATGGDVVVKTGQVSTTSDIQHTPTERLRINTSGKATFTGEVGIHSTLSTSQTTVSLLNSTATTVNAFGAATNIQIGAATGITNVNNNLDVDLDLNVDGGDITTNTATFNLLNTNATTVNAFGAATTIEIGAASGTTNINNNLVVEGNLTVNGTTTTMNSTTISVDDKNIELGSVASPTDTTADGGGITLKGATDKTLNWINSTDSWTSSENFELASAKAYRINGNSVLNSTTLGTAVVNSSLQQLGTINTGVWQGSVINSTYGGTGINNGGRTITVAGNLTTTGANALTLNTTGVTSVTLPTSGTLAIIGNPLSQFATTTSAQLAGVISNETGSGALVFGTSPSFTTGINAASTTMALFNSTARTINFGQAATSLVMGATTGTTRVRNNLDVDGDINVDGGDLTFSDTTINVANTTATTINFGQAATSLVMGAATGTTRIRNILDVDGDINVDGGDLTTNAAVFNLLNTNATTVNFAGDAATINIGASTSTVNFADDIDVAGTATFGSISVSQINNIPIGNVTPSTGAFTTLAANGLTTFTNTTASTSTGSGAVVVSGGLGVVGAVYADSFNGNIDAANLTSGNIPNARITVSNVTQHQASITGTGALNSGSITTGFGSINIGTSTFTGNGSGLTSLNASNLTAGTVQGTRLGGNQSMAGVKTFTNTSASNAYTNGAVRIQGGLGVALDIRTNGTIFGNGSGITAINAGNISTGTIADGRLPTTQVGKTFSSDITANSHKVGRGGGNIATNLAVAGGQNISNGTDNSVFGVGAMAGIVTGSNNTAVGNTSLASLTSATHNTAVGNDSQSQRTSTGNFNTSVGAQSMANSTSGSSNSGFGYQALELANGNNNVAVGALAGDTLTTGSNNIIVGYNAQPSAVGVSNEITLGTATHNSLRIPGVNLTVSTTQLSFTGTTGFNGIGTNLTALNASNLTSGNIPNARITVSNVTQHQASITGTGALNSGSITTGFGSINIGADNLTATGTVSLGATSFNESNVTGIVNLYVNNQIISTGDTNTYIQFHAADQWRVVTGGVERLEVNNTRVFIANNLVVSGANGVSGIGTNLTALNANNLSSGTVANARITGTYSNLTGTGALNSGSITSGFGNINIGTSTFTGNGSGLTSVNANVLDGIDSASFVRSDANDTVTGLITTSRSGEQMRFADTSATGSPYVGFYQGATRRGYIQSLTGGTMRIASDRFASRLDIGNGTTGLTYTDGTTWTVWHSGNDGAGSGLDADRLDGISSASFLRSDAADSFSGTLSGAGSINITGTVTATSFTGNGSGLTGVTAGSANTLDGIDSTQFLRSDAADQKTAGTLRFNDNVLLTLGTSNDFELYHNGTGNFMDLNLGDLSIRDTTTTRFTFARTTGNFTATGTVTATSFTGNGSGLTALNASNLTSGNIPNARITVSNVTQHQASITGTGALNSGSITSSFGNINIGTSTFTGNGSGLTSVNAATLDGIDSASFVRSDANDTVTGLITTSRSSEQMRFAATSATGSPSVGFYQGATRRGYIQMVNGGTMRIASDQFASRLDIGNGTTGLKYTDGTTWTVWHSGNDGAGSGLDADRLDGISSASFLRSDAADQKTAGTLRFNDNVLLTLGTSNDFELYHNGTGNFMDLNLGNLSIRDTTTTRFTFARTTGNFTATGEITAFSDITLKDNIEVIADPLTKILSIRGVTFTRNDLADTETRHMGVIAQEVEQYFPEVVQTTEDGIKTVNYGAMAGAFIEAFKDQQNQIDELRTMVQKLLDK